MTTIHCTKLDRQAEAMPRAPFPGELGNKIFKEISAEAWQMWLGRQTILINEYRLSALDPKAKQFLRDEMQKFLFEDTDSAMPDAYTPQSN